MISAIEALNLPKAQITDEDTKLAYAVLAKIDRHVHKNMTFAGVDILELQPSELSFAAAKIVAVMVKRLGWNMNANFGVKQSELGGRTTIWQIALSPTIEVYEQALTSVELPAPKLDA